MKNMDHVRLHAVRGSVPCRFCGRI
jgi:hypothetical protein